MQRRLQIEYQPMALTSTLKIESLVSFHYYQYAPTYAGLLEKHDFWEMVYADSGSIICNAGGREFRLTQGQAIFHPPMEDHSVVALGSSGNACILSFVCHDLDSAMFQGRVISFSRQERDLVSSIYAEGRRVFEPPYNAFVQARLHKRVTVPLGGEQMLCNMLENLLILLVRDLLNCPAISSSAAERHAPVYRRTHFDAEAITRRIIQYLQDNLEAKLTMRDISAAMSFSEGHLQSIFKKQTGQSIIRYFNMLKIERAKELICEGQYSFTQIGGLLGFGSVHYFSRVFRAYVHMSPSEYDKSVRLSAML